MLRLEIRSHLRVAANHANRRTLASRESPLKVAFKTTDDEDDEVRYRTQKNPVIPGLLNVEKRWSKMDAGEQDDIIAYLEDKMRGDWHALTSEERKAAQFVWFGAWGPRDTTANDSSGVYGGFAKFMTAALATVTGYKLWEYYASESEEKK